MEKGIYPSALLSLFLRLAQVMNFTKTKMIVQRVCHDSFENAERETRVC